MIAYQFLKKTPELVVQRRLGLDRYANIAQSSQFTVHLLVLVCEWVASVQVRNAKKARQKDDADVLVRTSGTLKFTLGTEVAKGYGAYGQWVFGIAWTAWLIFLCINETAPDYLHLTKRFGLIAASQLPIHYLLAATKNSYRLNMSLHKVTGKIVIAFFALHISLYSIFFVQFGIFWNTIQQSYIVVALTSAGILFVLGITSIQFFRRRYYWWFYKLHVVGSAVVLPLLFFHVNPIRIYLFESAAVLVTNALLRMISP